MEFKFPNIIDRTEGKLHDTVQFAKSVGLWEGQFRSLRSRLSYLATYANRRGCMEDRHVKGQGTRCILYKDFSPYGFAFQMQRLVSGEWVNWFHGGLLYSGPSQPADGSFPLLSVSLERQTSNGWSTHT